MLRRKQGRVIPLFLLAIGLTSLAYSFISTSTILVFIGLGLTFWGVLLLYVTNERYVKQSLLSVTTISSLINLNNMLKELNYQGKATYLPPQYFTTSETKVYIPKHPTNTLPTPREIQQQGDVTLLTSPEAALIIPPGLALTWLFEDTLGTSFTNVDLKQLQQDLPKLLIEDLEIAESLEINIEPSDDGESLTTSEPRNLPKNTMIHIKIANSIYEDISNEVVNLSTGYPISRIGCPIFSALACMLAKTTGKPITIERLTTSEDGKTFEATYRVLDAEEQVVELAAMKPLVQHLSPISLLLTASGAIILTWVVWLVRYDITTWSKDIVLILFGSRTGEVMSLGLGITAIHYLLVGVVLLVLGLITFRLNIIHAIKKKL